MEVASTNQAEASLVGPLIDSAATDGAPSQPIHDPAAVSDRLRNRLAERGIELTCTHRKNACERRRKTVRTLSQAAEDRVDHRLTPPLQRLVTRNEVKAHLFP